MIGSFCVQLGNTCNAGITGKEMVCYNDRSLSVKAEQMATTEPSIRKAVRIINDSSKAQISEYEAAMRKMDAALSGDAKLQTRLLCAEYGTVEKRAQRIIIKRTTEEKALLRAEVVAALKQDHEAFLRGEYTREASAGVVKVENTTQRGTQESFKSSFWKRSVKKACGTPRKNKMHMTADELTQQILALAGKSNLQVEFIGKGRYHLRAQYVRVRDNLIPKVMLPHERGVYKFCELDYNKVQRDLMSLCTFAKYRSITDKDMVSGCSGFCFDERSLITCVSTRLPHFVVRGRMDGKLVNALETVENIEEVHHY
nr:P1 [Hardenbergia mosaic virus]